MPAIIWAEYNKHFERKRWKHKQTKKKSVPNQSTHPRFQPTLNGYLFFSLHKWAQVYVDEWKKNNIKNVELTYMNIVVWRLNTIYNGCCDPIRFRSLFFANGCLCAIHSTIISSAFVFSFIYMAFEMCAFHQKLLFFPSILARRSQFNWKCSPIFTQSLTNNLDELPTITTNHVRAKEHTALK